MNRLPLILACAVLLMGAKCSSTPENEALMAAVFGADVAAKTALPSQALAVETSSSLVSSEEPIVELLAAVEPEVVEPEPVVELVAVEVCEPDWLFRGVMQPGACHVEYR